MTYTRWYFPEVVLSVADAETAISWLIRRRWHVESLCSFSCWREDRRGHRRLRLRIQSPMTPRLKQTTAFNILSSSSLTTPCFRWPPGEWRRNWRWSPRFVLIIITQRRAICTRSIGAQVTLCNWWDADRTWNKWHFWLYFFICSENIIYKPAIAWLRLTFWNIDFVGGAFYFCFKWKFC